LPANGQEDRWLLAASSELHAEYIDVETVSTSGRRVTAWVKREYFEPYTDEAGDTYNREVMRVRYDCQARTMAVMDVHQHLDNRVVWSGNLSSEAPVAVSPESVGEGSLQTACSLIPD